MSESLILPLLIAVLTGGIGSEAVRWWTGRNKATLDLFYPTWRNEMERLHQEMALMRGDILKLSEEVRRLGGDPLAVRYGIVPIVVTEDPEEDPDE